MSKVIKVSKIGWVPKNESLTDTLRYTFHSYQDRPIEALREFLEDGVAAALYLSKEEAADRTGETAAKKRRVTIILTAEDV